MLPTELAADPANPNRHRGVWYILRRDLMIEVPGFPLSADVATGKATMRQVTARAQIDQPEKYEDCTYDFGPNGLCILRLLGSRAYVLALCLALGLTLSACAFTQKVQMFTAADVANAKAVAIASGDTPGAACWTSLGPIVAEPPNPNAEGLATAAEKDRLLHATVGGSCGAILAPVLLNTLNQVPSLLAPLAHLPVP